MGINKISDLRDKIIEDREYMVKWGQLCTDMQKSLEKGEKPILPFPADKMFNKNK